MTRHLWLLFAVFACVSLARAQTPDLLQRGFPTFPLTVANGGTGAATLTGVLIGTGTGAVTASSQLPVASGGTGAASLTGVLVGNGTSAMTAISGTASQVVLGTGAVGSVPGAALTGTTGSIGGGILGAGACATGTVNVTGATTSMSATASPLLGADPTNGGVLGVSISAAVTSAGVVTVRLCAPIAGTPTSATYKVVVQ